MTEFIRPDLVVVLDQTDFEEALDAEGRPYLRARPDARGSGPPWAPNQSTEPSLVGQELQERQPAEPPSRRRSSAPGWILFAMNDPAGRRGLWMRDAPDGALELCWGREGDDGYVRIARDARDADELLRRLRDMTTLGTWACDEAGIPTRSTEGRRWSAQRAAQQRVRLRLAQGLPPSNPTGRRNPR